MNACLLIEKRVSLIVETQGISWFAVPNLNKGKKQFKHAL